MIKITEVFFFSVLLLFSCHLAAQNADTVGKVSKLTSFRPAERWFDDRGEVINAHGGGIIFFNKKYYWFGEKRGRRATEGVNVYSSTDLYNWKFEALALSPDMTDTNSVIAMGCIMERPKVVYNEKTRKFVMWFHHELKGQGYKAARAGVALSDKITGPYRFIESLRPNGNMARDMGLFKEGNTVYHIFSSNENRDLRMVKLSDDYLKHTAQDSMIFSQKREAPAVFRHEGKYYLVTSGLTGFRPNKASYHVAANLFGPWELIGDPMMGPQAELTFLGQSTFVLPVAGKKNAFIFMADKWNSSDLKDSRHIWLPIQFVDGKMVIDWQDEWDLSWFNKKH